MLSVRGGCSLWHGAAAGGAAVRSAPTAAESAHVANNKKSYQIFREFPIIQEKKLCTFSLQPTFGPNFLD